MTLEVIHSMNRDIASAIIRNLESRKGFDAFWDDIEEDIQDEILEEIALTIEGYYDC